MGSTRHPSYAGALAILLLGAAACGDDEGPQGTAQPAPLAKPLSGTDDGAAVTFTHGIARSLAGLTDVWDYGVHPDSAPFAIILSTASISCATSLDGNPPQGYSLLITFPDGEVASQAEKHKLFRHKDGWIDTNGADVVSPATITAADGGSFNASLDITWEWYDGKKGELSGDLTVTSCLAP